PGSGLCVFPLCRRQGRYGLPRWRNHRALRRYFRSHRSGRRNLVQPQAERRLSHRLRANPLENNLVLWKLEKGKRSSVKWIRNTPTPTRQWHDLEARIAGPKSRPISTANFTWSMSCPSQFRDESACDTQANRRYCNDRNNSGVASGAAQRAKANHSAAYILLFAYARSRVVYRP